VAGGGVALAIAGAPRVDVNHAGKAGTFGMMVALPLFIMASAPFRWRAGAKRLAWVAVTGGQLLGWAAVAGYAPKAVAVFGARSPRYSAGLDGGD